MNIETLHVGMKVRHPQYGVGVVKSLTGHTAEIAFDDAHRTIAPASSDLQPAEPTAALSELQVPLANLIRDTAHAVIEALGLEQQDALVEGLATRWQKGALVMQPADNSLQSKEVECERQTERSGQVRPATVHHALLRIAHHVQHPVQKQRRPAPK
jgi:hypothetical protein